MLHVDDWLDDPANKNHIAREFLEHSRRPAVDMDRAWLRSNRPTAEYRGKRFQVVGASRMGDVWLNEIGYSGNAFYTNRVDIAELTAWSAP